MGHSGALPTKELPLEERGTFRWPSSPLGVSLSIALASLVLAYLSPVIGGASVAASFFTLWLPIGLIYATTLRLGWRALPGIMLGQLLSEWIFGTHGLWAAVVLSIGNAAYASVMVMWSNHHQRRQRANGQAGVDVLATPGVFALSMVASLVGSVPNAVAGASVLMPPDAHWWVFLAQFILGDLGGAVLLGPLLWVLIRPQPRQWRQHRPEFLWVAVASIVLFHALLVIELGMPGWVYMSLLLPVMLGISARYTQAQAIALCSVLMLGLVARAGDGATALQTDPSISLDLASKSVALLFMLTALLFTSARRALDGVAADLRKVNQVLLRAESVAKIGSWQYDLLHARVYWSPQTAEMLGFPANTVASRYEDFLGVVHPEDRNDLEMAWQAALAGAPYETKFRVLVNGETRWFRERAEFERDERGRPVMAWGTIQDISQELATFEAASAQARAESSSRTKSHFLATLSHEIRTPLNGVIGLARIAREKDLSLPMRMEYLRLLEDSAQSLNAVITDVLDISKIESGRMEIESVAFSLRDLLGSLIKTHRLLAEDKGLVAQLDADPSLPPQVLGDPTRLRQVLNNYLSNALKFTPQGRITLRARPDGDQMLFEVEDTGIGIEPEAAGRLFGLFHQADASNTRRFGGTGLGLAICRELATLMGGTVGLRTDQGQGSVFWLRVPLPKTDVPEPVEIQPPAAAQPLADLPLKGLNILMAEDNKVNALVAVQMLERAGARVRTVGDGQAAVDAVWHAWGRHALAPDDADPFERFDLVLMDVHMPMMDGLEAARTIRSLEAEGAMPTRLPILAMTAGVLTEQVQEALDAGMDDFIPKPLSRGRLLEAVRHWSRVEA